MAKAIYVADEVHRQAKLAAVAAGVTVGGYVTSVLEGEGVVVPSNGGSALPSVPERSEEKAKERVIRPGSLLARMGKMDPVPAGGRAVSAKVPSDEELMSHPIFEYCEDPGCNMKIRHGKH
jgi:hypothetical protein